MSGRIEVVARVSGRRAWTVEVRASIERHEVSSGLLYTWRRQATSGELTGTSRAALPCFAEARMADPAPSAALVVVVFQCCAELPPAAAPRAERAHASALSWCWQPRLGLVGPLGQRTDLRYDGVGPFRASKPKTSLLMAAGHDQIP